jgi:hypothetical protein
LKILNQENINNTLLSLSTYLADLLKNGMIRLCLLFRNGELESENSWVPVVHTCNPTKSGGRDQGYQAIPGK